MNKEILIWTVPGDIHARAVEWALEAKGIGARVLLGSDFPTKHSLGINISNSYLSLDTASHSGENAFSGMRSLWRRREGLPVFDEELDPSDIVPAQVESKQFLEGYNHLLDGKFDFCANPYSGAVRARNKITQLNAARKAGLRIPDTLISSSASELRSFTENGRRDVIVKSFTSPSWIDRKDCHFAYAAKVRKEFLSDERSISAVPAIYQECIEKSFEVRTLIMGEHSVSAKIFSQDDEISRSDWRRARTSNLRMEPHILPAKVLDRCLDFMSILGIVCGSFDFAVTPSGEYIFFEVNEQGQFLWMEERLPELRTLDMFSEFLVEGSSTFTPNGRGRLPATSFSDFFMSGFWQQSLVKEREQCATYYHRPPAIEEGTFEDFAKAMRGGGN